MTKRKTSLAIGLTAACVAVLCAAGACNGIKKEEKDVQRVIVTSIASTSQTTEPVSTTSPPTTAAPVTTTAETTAYITTVPQTTTCSATEQGLGEMPLPTTTTEQATAADTTVQPTMTSTAATATTPAPTELYHAQTSGDYIYVNGFGWVYNEGGGGYGETNHEMYCNGNKIGYFG